MFYRPLSLIILTSCLPHSLIILTSCLTTPASKFDFHRDFYNEFAGKKGVRRLPEIMFLTTKINNSVVFAMVSTIPTHDSLGFT